MNSVSLFFGKHRSALLSLFFILAYLLCVSLIMPVRKDHIILVIVYIGLILLKKHEFTRDVIPLLMAWLSYDSLRGFVDHVVYRVSGQWALDLDVLLLGWLFNGQSPPIWFHEHGGILWVTAFTGIFYIGYIVFSVFFALYLWFTRHRGERNYEYYWQFVISFFIIALLGMTTFYLLPTAPPWYYEKCGFTYPCADYEGGPDTARLNDVDALLGVPVFASFYSLESNPFAAFPSLHVGYPVLAALLSRRKWGRKGEVVWLFPLIVAFSAMYLNHHWFIDVVAGFVYGWVSFTLGTRIVIYYRRKYLKKTGTAPV